MQYCAFTIFSWKTIWTVDMEIKEYDSICLYVMMLDFISIFSLPFHFSLILGIMFCFRIFVLGFVYLPFIPALLVFKYCNTCLIFTIFNILLAFPYLISFSLFQFNFNSLIRWFSYLLLLLFNSFLFSPFSFVVFWAYS